MEKSFRIVSEQEFIKNKKCWIDYLYYNIGKQNYDFELCGTYKKNDELKFSKWKKYSECIFPLDYDGTCDNWQDFKFFEKINQRQILPNELVLDLEEKKSLPEVIKKLNILKFNYHIFSTGSRGYHIHIFFKKEINQKEKLALIKYFGADEQKNSKRCLIALENTPHWKSNKLKSKIKWI